MSHYINQQLLFNLFTFKQPPQIQALRNLPAFSEQSLQIAKIKINNYHIQLPTGNSFKRLKGI